MKMWKIESTAKMVRLLTDVHRQGKVIEAWAEQ
jgi:hypothetical protein